MSKLELLMSHDSFNSKMVEGARLLLEGLGEVTGGDVSSIDLSDPNFLKTPYRIAKSYLEMCEGLALKSEIKTIFETSFPSDYDGLVLIDQIDSNSMCPHHFLPVKYRVDFAYIPDKHMLGLSKIPRFIKILAKQPILQEDYTKQLITIFNEHVHPLGSMVIVTGIHNCMVCRGVMTSNSAAITSEVYGVFEKVETRLEFFELLKQRR